MDTKSFEISYRIQIPTANNWYTSGFKRLIGIGKTINKQNLWYYNSRALNLGILEFRLNWKPCYYKYDSPSPFELDKINNPLLYGRDDYIPIP